MEVAVDYAKETALVSVLFPAPFAIHEIPQIRASV
jgi:hypothetical protein